MEEEIQWFTKVWKYAKPHESSKKRKLKEHEMSPFALYSGKKIFIF